MPGTHRVKMNLSILCQLMLQAFSKYVRICRRILRKNHFPSRAMRKNSQICFLLPCSQLYDTHFLRFSQIWEDVHQFYPMHYNCNFLPDANIKIHFRGSIVKTHTNAGKSLHFAYFRPLIKWKCIDILLCKWCKGVGFKFPHSYMTIKHILPVQVLPLAILIFPKS